MGVCALGEEGEERLGGGGEGREEGHVALREVDEGPEEVAKDLGVARGREEGE
jgi:hypothetical protein